jgi:hypothetical protein
MKGTVLLVLLAIGVLSSNALSESRLYLASQYDWGKKLGFYLDLEGNKLAELPLILGTADGQDWRFDSARPGFVTGRRYAVRAIVEPDGSHLFLDDQLVAESKGTWAPAPLGLEANAQPAWAADLGDWLAVVHAISVTVKRDGRETARRAFAFADAEVPMALRLFERLPGETMELTTNPGDSVTIEVSLEFAAADTRRWAPLVDRYGQCRYAEWPEKVRSDDDLVAEIAQEDAELAAMPPSPEYDEHGGYMRAGWRETATGFFRLVRRDGRWWLISPAGNPCFYVGVCGFPNLTWPATPVSERQYLFEWLPPQAAPWSAARGWNYWGIQDGTEYVCLYTCNLIRKYGSQEWTQRALERGARRLRAWGFSGVGKWGGHEQLASIPVLHRWGVPSLVRHPDVFDPQVRERFRQDLEAQVAPQRNDPRVLGWSLGNEFDEIITADEVAQVLRMPPETPARRALLDHAVEAIYGGSLPALSAAWGTPLADRAALYAAQPSPPAEDLEKLRRFYADRYYAFIYETVKRADPNHLYLGFWIVPGWWANESDWLLIAPHCDVIGYDRYGLTYSDTALERLKAQAGKPVLCGEFSFPAFYGGRRGFGRYGAVSADGDAQAGELYARWVQDAAKDPYCVGVSYFKYRDQPLTGRGPGRGDVPVIGEHFAFGLVTETDRPKWDQVRQMREANLRAARWRLEATR